MTADSSANYHSPRSPAVTSDAVISPHRKTLPSPWAKVVRGADPETLSPSSSPPIPAPEQDFSDCSASRAQSLSPPPPPDNSDNGNGNVGVPKKAAWKPLNGDVKEGPVPVGGPVMGASSWPPLSESTRPSLKSSSSPPSDSSKHLSDGSSSVPLPSSQGPVISHSPQKQVPAKPNPNPPVRPVRRPMKRGAGGGGTGGVSGQSGFNRPPPPPPLPPSFPRFETPNGNLLPAVLDSPPVREPSYRGNNWEARPMGVGVGSHSHAVNDHSSQQRNSSRRGNFGPRPRGDGLYHNNGYQDRNWNTPRSSNARDFHLPPTMGPPQPYRGFIRPPPPPPGATPFITPQHVRPYGNPMGFDMASPYLYVQALPPEPYRTVPLVANPPQPPMYFPPTTPPLPTLLVNQIDYYFSDANLVKDDFLRANMDVQGWVPISLIASFRRVQSLTDNIQLILDSLRASTVVEIQGDKVRRRNDWKKWLSSSDRPGLGAGSLATALQKVKLEDATTDIKRAVDMVDESLKEDTAEKAQ